MRLVDGQLDDEVCSGWFAVGKGFPSRVRFRVPTVQHLISGGDIRVLHAFRGRPKEIMEALAGLRKKTWRGGGGRATASEPTLATSLAVRHAIR